MEYSPQLNQANGRRVKSLLPVLSQQSRTFHPVFRGALIIQRSTRGSVGRSRHDGGGKSQRQSTYDRERAVASRLTVELSRSRSAGRIARWLRKKRRQFTTRPMRTGFTTTTGCCGNFSVPASRTIGRCSRRVRIPEPRSMVRVPKSKSNSVSSNLAATVCAPRRPILPGVRLWCGKKLSCASNHQWHQLQRFRSRTRGLTIRIVNQDRLARFMCQESRLLCEGCGNRVRSNVARF